MSTCVDSGNVIKYVPFISFVHPSFWHALSELKLNVDQLNETSKALCGHFTNILEVPTVFEVDGTSLNQSPDTVHNYVNMTGMLLNKNTVEEFKTLDKAALLNDVGEMILSNIVGKEWIRNPSALLHFILLSFADLKKFSYYYWFAFPAPCQPTVHLHGTPQTITTEFSNVNLLQLVDKYDLIDREQRPFFIILKKGDQIVLKILSEYLDANLKNQEVNLMNTYFVFADPSNGINPGWPLRIYIAALLEHCPHLVGSTLKIIGLRFSATGSIERSYIFTVKVPENVQGVESAAWVGWERNYNNKLGPKLADMSLSMDPIRLADTSSNLNIKLMKWRLAPNLDVNIMKSIKCLLLGAGTLGCHVARNLLAWGFRHITFVDNGKVSYSNPCRQVLFTHEDCFDGGKQKAQAAARNLELILPTVRTEGIPLHIPMPGHPVGDALKAETINNIEILINAIEQHDVIFLLLDTREARWLPTLIGACHEKIVINAALGFDSCLVMRHGVYQETEEQPSSSINSQYLKANQLGCYFCNDVTAPGDSMKDRALDQQCTVTRPGVAAIAGALAVELLVGLLQHPLRANAPAAYNLNDDMESGLSEELQGVLGPIPHSIRTFLHSYESIAPTCPKFKQCIACSDAVINQYKAEGTGFLLKVFNNGSYLEEVTGLHELHMAAEMNDVLEFSDESDE